VNRRELYESLKRNPKNVRFEEICHAAETFGFTFRGGKGSHRIYVKPGVRDLLNFQNAKGKAKPYKSNSSCGSLSNANFGRNKMMSKYAIEIFYSEEDEGYIAIAPELPGCSAFGETEEEALTEIKVAMELWLETARKEARPIPQPLGKPLLQVGASV
jgi:predicted RNase H-like HicB family nuclease